MGKNGPLLSSGIGHIGPDFGKKRNFLHLDKKFRDIDELHSFYQTIDHNHQPQPPTVNMGEPCMVNPCSYASVETVLRHIHTICDVGNSRKWTYIGCNGLPYVLGSKLIEKDRSLQDILLMPAMGHIEINMVRAAFKRLWDFLLIDLAKMLNFRSPKALAACQKAFDHHKSWQIICIAFFGTCDELIVPFIRSAIENKTNADLQSFYSFLANVKNDNYNFLKDAIFTYLFAIILFRAGERRNNSQVILAARIKFSSIFFGFNMPFYQQIEFRDTKLRSLMPVELKPFVANNETFSLSGKNFKGEGEDFILENRNKLVKQWMPAGVPDEKRWLRSARNVDKLHEIRKLFVHEEESAYVFKINLEKEIFHWRKKLRNDNFVSSPMDIKALTSLSGQEMDNDLVNFAQRCKENKAIYFSNMSEGFEHGKAEKLTPVFIKTEDREKFHDIKNKTKKEIENMIFEGIRRIRQLGESDTADVLRDTWEIEKMKNARKEGLLSFYKEVTSALEEASINSTEDEDADGVTEMEY